MENTPDFIVLSETKINSNTPLDTLHLPGYAFLHVDSQASSGGVGIFL